MYYKRIDPEDRYPVEWSATVENGVVTDMREIVSGATYGHADVKQLNLESKFKALKRESLDEHETIQKVPISSLLKDYKWEED